MSEDLSLNDFRRLMQDLQRMFSAEEAKRRVAWAKERRKYMMTPKTNSGKKEQLYCWRDLPSEDKIDDAECKRREELGERIHEWFDKGGDRENEGCCNKEPILTDQKMSDLSMDKYAEKYAFAQQEHKKRLQTITTAMEELRVTIIKKEDITKMFSEYLNELLALDSEAMNEMFKTTIYVNEPFETHKDVVCRKIVSYEQDKNGRRCMHQVTKIAVTPIGIINGFLSYINTGLLCIHYDGSEEKDIMRFGMYKDWAEKQPEGRYDPKTGAYYVKAASK